MLKGAGARARAMRYFPISIFFASETAEKSADLAISRSRGGYGYVKKMNIGAIILCITR
jgi:hypothetical protein